MENCKRVPPAHEFSDSVFSWTIEDILDENLYRDKVAKIPELFHSVDQYLASYLFPLLEETRAEMSSAIANINEAPFAKVMSLTEVSKGEDISFYLYDVKVDSWKNKFLNCGSKVYRMLPGDVILLLNGKPRTSDDLRVGRKWAFASVTNTKGTKGDDDDDDDHNFEVKIENRFEVGDGFEFGYVVFLMNITTNKRIWNALHMRKNLELIEKVLFNNDMADEFCEPCSRRDCQLNVKTRPDFLSRLNESQREVIFSTMQSMQCEHMSSVKLVWGPPGTGKTWTLSVMLFFLLKIKVRTLICTPTNTSIIDLCSRVIKLMRKSCEAEKDCLSCPLVDILIFGKDEGLEVSSDFEEISLEYRVDKLAECFDLAKGWKHCIVSMICFLDSCVFEQQIKESVKDVDDKTKERSLLDFARKDCKHEAVPLRRCMSTLLTYLPTSFFGEQNFQCMVQLISLLDSLEEKFSCLVGGSSKSTVDALSLICEITECLRLLRSLHLSLAKVGLPSVMSKAEITEFCFQTASLIFCTASSSFKLHNMDYMKPVKLLVVDEAPQLKECESIIPLQLQGLRHAILVGDECQLQARIISKFSEKAGFGRSLFGRLSSIGRSKHLLNVQYRMHPSISFFPNSKFYDKKMLDAEIVKPKSYGRSCLPGRMYGPYYFVNIFGGKEEMDVVRNSQRNMVEVALVVKLVQKLFKAWNDSKEKLSIGVTSPYAAQVMAIKDKISVENSNKFKVTVKPIEGFQGGEEDIMIISTVRSNIDGLCSLLSCPHKTNVALTRARRCLLIFGDERTLTCSHSVWEAIIRDSKDRQCFFNADEDGELVETIIEAKKELNQLDDLLNRDSKLFENARWKVQLSDTFRSSFGNLISPHVKKSVICLLLKISTGWRPKRRCVDLTCVTSSQIVKQFKVEGYYVLCTIDLRKEFDYEQVLKVWDILFPDEIRRFLKRLDTIFNLYTKDFINHCKEEFFDGNLEVPKHWPITDDIVRYKNTNNIKLDNGLSVCEVDCRGYVENSKVSESLMLMKFYSLSSGVVNHLLSDHNGREVYLPFEVTDEEREIILFPRSSFILGRSGTGKTTVLTMKLCRNMQHHSIASEGFNSSTSSSKTILRQLFITVSPKLCFAVKQHLSRLISFVSNGPSYADNNLTDINSIDEMGLFEDIPDTFVGIPTDKFPLFITFHKFLMMLDGTLGNSYFQKFPHLRGFSRGNRSLRSVALQTFIRTKEVDYDRFFSFYWPHFNKKLTKNLDPSRVFIEIMYYIKGGLHTLVSKEDYISMSKRRISTLTEDEREVIYDIFKDYEKMKSEKGEFDCADLVLNIHLRLGNGSMQGDKMEFVYIDEVQDLTMGQIALLRHVCKNVDEGFIFSGDTAQTIARGVDFRFEDLRSLFYTEFVMKSKITGVARRRDKGLITEMFYLRQNFRTHSGVLKLARSVTDLLSYFFPQSIDILAPESSFVDGEPPVVLNPGTDEGAIINIFGGAESIGGNIVGFGAEQVILVRDDSVREKLSRYVGPHSLILTILESKGLEFQDVLLYNFFDSSPLMTRWRVVHEFLREKDKQNSRSLEFSSSFSQVRHSILCSELKQLYVAITRTRQRLWIWENNMELFEPMYDYWKRLNLIHVRNVDDALGKAVRRASSPEEWKAQGIQLFWDKKYTLAITCFKRADEPVWEKWAKASSLRAASEQTRVSDPKAACRMLREAAEMFYSLCKLDSAAKCFIDLNEYERAGRIYLEKSGESNIRKAGECFTLAKCYELAADVYAKGNLFEECLSVCHKGKCYEKGLHYVEEYWKQQKSSTVMKRHDEEFRKIGQEFLENCALDYYNNNDNLSAMKFVRAFYSMEGKRKFLKSLGHLEDLLSLETESENFKEAVEIAKQLGDTLLEVDLLGKAGHFKEASLLTLACVLSSSLWEKPGSKGWPLKPFSLDKQLINQAMSFAHKESENFYEFACAEVKLLSHERSELTELMQYFIASRKHGSLTAEILSVRKILDAHLHIHRARYKWELEAPVDITSYSQRRLLLNQVSARSLFYFWNLFKDYVFDTLKSLDCLERNVFSECKRTIDFCLNYFGVRRVLNDLVFSFHLLYPNADWVKDIDKESILWHRNVASVESHHLVSAFRIYWLRELLFVGIRVVRALGDLKCRSKAKSSFEYFQQSCLTCIFDLANVFMYLPTRKWKFQSFVELPLKYFDIVFLSDNSTSLSEDIVSLRRTRLSRDLLEEVIVSNIRTRKEVTYEQIGRIVMIWLGSGLPKPELHEMIVRKFPKASSWKEFVEILGTIDELNSAGFVELVEKFNEALKETYVADWSMKGYMSPPCFFYLTERFIILASQCNGYFFTTKSAFVEWSIYRENCGHPRGSLVTAEKLPFKENVFRFLVDVMYQFITERCDTEEWITSCDIDFKYCYPVLVLRSFVILCLLCLNSRMYSDVLFELLNGPQAGRFQLPREFREALGRGRKSNEDGVSKDAVAEAFKMIRDPMVIVNMGEKKLDFVCPNAICVDTREYESVNDIMRVLFRPSNESSEVNATVSTSS